MSRAISGKGQIMGYALRSGVSCCRIGDRLVLLDRINDRYFGLSERAEQALIAIIAAPDAGDALDAPLIATGLLTAVAHGAPALCVCQNDSLRFSMIEPEPRASRLGATLKAAMRQRASRWRLRWRGFDRSLHRFERLRAIGDRQPAFASERATEVAQQHRSAALLVATQRQCLPNSLAIACHLAALGMAPRLVIGVKLRPFEAHCWVELDDMLVNDRIDTVRAFTPILIV